MSNGEMEEGWLGSAVSSPSLLASEMDRDSWIALSEEQRGQRKDLKTWTEVILNKERFPDLFHCWASLQDDWELLLPRDGGKKKLIT